MDLSPDFLERLATYPRAVVCWVGDDGYPVQTPASFRIDAEQRKVLVARTGLRMPTDREVNVIAGHIRPLPGWGYDERRYITLAGRLSEAGEELALSVSRTWGWDEALTPFFQYVESSNPQAKRYMEALSLERGVRVKPRLSPVWTFLLATRFPFLTATIVPVLLGIAVAARDGFFDFGLAALTLIGAAAVHIGLNVANDVFDALSGADEANTTPTQFSGGSRVIQRGLLSLPRMIALSLGGYTIAIAIGLYLVIERGSTELLAIGAVGVLISVFYTAPPVRLVHRGLGELTTAVGFGPVMVLGAYVVQTQSLSFEAFLVSIPVAILIALVLFVNEIPDRQSDASVGKRTLPVRMSNEAVARLFLVAALSAFAVVAAGAVSGVLPVPSLVALAALPLALQVHRGIKEHYDRPYELMATMGRNVQLHLMVGMLLFGGYLLVLLTSAILEPAPSVLR